MVRTKKATLFLIRHIGYSSPLILKLLIYAHIIVANITYFKNNTIKCFSKNFYSKNKSTVVIFVSAIVCKWLGYILLMPTLNTQPRELGVKFII